MNYCGIYGGFNPEEINFGAIYTTVVKFENLDQTKVVKYVDIEINGFELKPQPVITQKDTNVTNEDIVVYELVTNISSGSNLAKRYFYKAECSVNQETQAKDCSKMILKNVKLMKGYPAEFIFITIDKRFLLAGMLKANKPGLYF